MLKGSHLAHQAIVAILASAAILVWVLWVVTRVFPLHFSQVGREAYHIVKLDGGGCFYSYTTPSTYWPGTPAPKEHGFSFPYLGGWYFVHHKEFRRLDLWFGFLPLAITLGLYPLLVLLRGPIRREVRRRRGECPWCGYDLTGNTSGRCPECGRKIADWCE